MSTDVAITGIGTALPAPRVTQAIAADAVIRLAGLDGGAAAWTRRLFARSGVATRHTVLRDVAEGRAPFGGDRRPGTAARMTLFREHAGPLAAEAADRALAAADVAARDVTHVIVVTCTGFHAPGVDVELVERLGLRPDVDRTVVGFMGCYGAFAGLRVARRAVLAALAEGSGTPAVALVVCVELCSLHFNAGVSPDSLVAYALFGDGAAAAVVTSGRPRRDTLFLIGPPATRVEPGTGSMMGWAVGDDGFEMSLAPSLPERIGGAVAEFVGSFATPGDVDAWCVHPGGPAILAAAERALGLDPAALDDSRAVLRDIGNVSSATILFVLERAAVRLDEGARGAALGFGPGLTFEGFGFERGGAATRFRSSPAVAVRRPAPTHEPLPFAPTTRTRARRDVPVVARRGAPV